MKKLATMIGALAIGAIVTLQGSASALPCTAGCAQEKNACRQTARLDKSACRQDCRENTPPTSLGACMIGCSTAYRAAKDDCKAGQTGCMDSCQPPTGPGQPSSSDCFGTCGKNLAACTKDRVGERKDCADGCSPGKGRGACMQDCVAAAKDGAATCRSDFDACREGCPSSPSAAFVE